jgi:hypothetical protein
MHYKFRFQLRITNSEFRITNLKLNSHESNDIKGAHAVLNHYQGSYVKALMHVYPSIGLEEDKFKHLPKSMLFPFPLFRTDLRPDYWSIDNQRSFFINFSKEHEFDPLVPVNWYSCSYWDLCNSKVREKTEKIQLKN